MNSTQQNESTKGLGAASAEDEFGVLEVHELKSYEQSANDTDEAQGPA